MCYNAIIPKNKIRKVYTMNKRIISMFLAVVMLILAVPVFALSSLATTEADIKIGRASCRERVYN